MRKRFRVSLLLNAQENSHTRMRSGYLRWIAQRFGELELLLEGLEGHVIIALAAVCPPKQDQRIRGLLAIARRLIELQRIPKEGYCLIEIALLHTQAAKTQLSSCLGPARIVCLCEIKRAFEVRASFFEFAARQQRIAEVYQTVGCHVSNIAGLRDVDGLQGDLLGALSIPFGKVDAA